MRRVSLVLLVIAAAVGGGPAIAAAAEPPVIVPAIEGVGESEAGPGYAEAAVVDRGGVVVGKSEASAQGSKVTILGAGGVTVLGKEGDEQKGRYTGAAAPAGAAVDAANQNACGAGDVCVQVAKSEAYSFSHGPYGVGDAHFTLLSVRTGPMNGVTIGETRAIAGRNTAGECRSAGISWVLSGVGPLSTIILLNPGGATHGVATSGVPDGEPC